MNQTALISPRAFVQEMERHWTSRLDNVASPALRLAWEQLASSFGRHILAHDDPQAGTEWTILQPPTGSGKSQGTAVYCSMLSKYQGAQHPGALIITRRKADADSMAETINSLAEREGYAFSYHSDKAGKGVLDSLWMYPALVITHRAYELALDHLGQEGSIRQTWPYFHTWGASGRKLIVIDEALDIVEESRGELEGLRLTLAAIPQRVRERHPKEVQAVATLVSILEQIADCGTAQVQETVLLKKMIEVDDAPPDMCALRASMREVRFDQQQGRSDLQANKALSGLHDDRLRSLQHIFTSWIYYAKIPIHGHTLNTARLLVPESVKGATVLDATASANVMYTLFDKAKVVSPPPGVRSYKNVTLHVSKGHKVGKVHLRNKGDPLIDRLIGTLNAQLPDKKVFLVTHKDVEAKLQARSTTFEMTTGHWGAVDGSNEWRDCDTAVIFGLPYRPDTWTANAFFALQGVRDTAWLRSKDRPFKGHSDIRAALKTGQIVTEVIQAVNRIRCRKVIDLHGNCPKSDIYLLIPEGAQGEAILKGIKDLMTGICVQPWELLGEGEAVKKSGRPAKVENAVLTYLENMWPGSVSVSVLKQELSMSAASLKRFIGQARDTTTEVGKALVSYGVVFNVEGKGRGARSTFVKNK